MQIERTPTATALFAALALCSLPGCSAREAGEPSATSSSADAEPTATSTAALAGQGDESDEDVSRMKPFLRPSLALAAAQTGTGYAQFSLCASGSACKGYRTQTTFYGAFSPTMPATDAGNPCTTTVAGACALTTCSGGGGGGAGASAGKLTIGGGQIGSVPIWTDSLQGFAYTFTQIGAGFAPGDALTLVGTGNKVPAFPTQSVAAPGPIDLTSPAAGARGSYTIPTSAPLGIAWTGGTAGNSVYFEGTTYSASGLRQVSCGWDASKGAGSVPKSLLAPLAGMRGSIAWGQQTAPQAFTAGGFTAQLGADNSGSASVKFQ